MVSLTKEKALVAVSIYNYDCVYADLYNFHPRVRVLPCLGHYT